MDEEQSTFEAEIGAQMDRVRRDERQRVLAELHVELDRLKARSLRGNPDAQHGEREVIGTIRSWVVSVLGSEPSPSVSRQVANVDGDRLYDALALFDRRDGHPLSNIVRAAREGYERSAPDMDEAGAWDEFDRLIADWRDEDGEVPPLSVSQQETGEREPDLTIPGDGSAASRVLRLTACADGTAIVKTFVEGWPNQPHVTLSPADQQRAASWLASVPSQQEGGGARIVTIIDRLRANYTPEGVGVWLCGAKRSLGGERVLDLLRQGRIDEVEAIVPDDGMVAT
jgi:hypothetical protein